MTDSDIITEQPNSWSLRNHWNFDGIQSDGSPSMTVEGTIAKLFLLLALFSAAFLVSWHHYHLLRLTETPLASIDTALKDMPSGSGLWLYTEFRYPLYAWLLFFLFFAGGFLTRKGLVLVAPVCAIVEGVGCGAFEYLVPAPYSGITLVCGMVVIGIFTGLFIIYWLGLTTTDNAVTQYLAGAVGGLLLTYVATLVLRSFAIDVPFLHEASVHWNGCVLVVLMLCCGCVVNTFGEIQRAIAIGAPKWVEWRAALCLLGSFVLLLQMVRRLLLNRSTRQLVWDVVSGALSRTSR
jgi:uncharacterized YccA/Bax inhibitor family protein